MRRNPARINASLSRELAPRPLARAQMMGTMKSPARICAGLAVALMGALVPSVWPLPTRAEDLPPNAQPKQYGSGWECKKGYRLQANQCVEVKVPENAFLSDAISGPGWACKYGYQAIGSACLAIRVPPNGYLSGPYTWECERGYRKVGTTCLAIAVPANGYLLIRPRSRLGLRTRLPLTGQFLCRHQGAAKRLPFGFAAR